MGRGGRRLHAGRPTKMHPVRVRRACGHWEVLLLQDPPGYALIVAQEQPCAACRATLPATGTTGWDFP